MAMRHARAGVLNDGKGVRSFVVLPPRCLRPKSSTLARRVASCPRPVFPVQMSTCLYLVLLALTAFSLVAIRFRWRDAFQQAAVIPLNFCSYGSSPALGCAYVYYTRNYIATFSLPQKSSRIRRHDISLYLQLSTPPEVAEKGCTRHLKIGLLLENGGESIMMIRFHTMEMPVTELSVPMPVVAIGNHTEPIRGTVALSLDERGASAADPGQILSAYLSVAKPR